MSKQTSDQDDTQKNAAYTAGEDKAAPSSSSTTGSPPNGAPGSHGDDSSPSTNTSASSQTPASSSSGQRSRRRQKSAKNAAQDTTQPKNQGANQSSDGQQASASSDPKKSGSSQDTSSSSAKSPASSSTPSSGNKQSPPSQSTPPTGGGKGKGGFAIVLVLLLAIAVGVVAWQGWLRLEAQQQRLNELSESSATQQAVDDLAAQLENAQAQREQQFDSTISELRDEFANYRSNVDDTLDDVLAQLSQEQETDERDWLHAEAAYLLRLANQRLQLEGDVEGATALLRTADARLEDADNPALTSVRREIANELAALDAVPRLDRTGVYLALNAQQERVAGLRLSQAVEERAVTSSIEQPPTGTFERQLARFGEELKDLVMIRHHDEALEALVTPEQESYLRQSLRLILEQSQLALLKEEQSLYEASIDKALELINGYYDTSREETQRVIERLEELKEVTVEPELPDISGSQQAMAEFIDNRHESRQQQEGGES
ncbi:uroporphyrinogen-III C-methyltransferase [Halomonas janggokensis]|jgi:uroporphyrin-3 C-methyltransferase|uniref:Uroporphyrinogen-III C-methyltransferase n=1 Tax=Vreelandella janggokensis TaxID=370767 RepID=A0ABT4IUZ2_9GAMM|nr:MULTISPECIES: uroporphyrinogen-III C-methyltransferase [Halomonas]MCZ0927493.1 uroporphyrinogen-III C-methyltransferase [Halomonas janggokensis]MCZ0930001.1 uroporphyrinogen-III C-methyltransferase [Halomonas janggokensis]QPL46063.1 uroporphyrinogen-III C-methyltransferase [Halomonas sp. A40-4]